MDILPLFCEIDDFCKVFEQLYQLKALGNGKQRKRATCLSRSEVMTIFERLMTRGLKLITKLRRNMENRFVELEDKILLRKRSIIEKVNNQLKNISNIEHTRHRSLWNFLGNIAVGLIAYSWKEKKPSLNLKRMVPSIIL
jgi:hypothetical protein